jgi:hypothetical protein
VGGTQTEDVLRKKVRKKFEHRRDKGTKDWRKLHND